MEVVDTEPAVVDEAEPPPVPGPKTLDSNDFMVIGNDKFLRKERIDMRLPSWLAHPIVIASDLSKGTTDMESDDELSKIAYLSPVLTKNLTKMGIKHLFPVQQSVIPWILDVHQKPAPFRPRDVCVSAPTGSGKTLAYALPICQLLLKRTDRRVRALIVLPVNELAIQVGKIMRKLCEGTTLTVALLSKFNSLEVEQKQLVHEFNGKHYSKVDIVVATTGRLVEHLHTTVGFSLRSLQFLVMDEADRIMEQISNNWLYHLDRHVKLESDTVLRGQMMPLCYASLVSRRQPHKMLFSATMSQDPEKLQNLNLFQPKLFTAIVGGIKFAVEDGTAAGAADRNGNSTGQFIGKFTTPAELTEQICITQPELKPLTLFALIKQYEWTRFLCFTNSADAAHRLSFVLQSMFGGDLKIEELSSGLAAPVRSSVLQKFHAGKINGLICTDALARGMDIENVNVVVSYDFPRHIKTYVHRVGRTARAGRPGLAVTMLARYEQKPFNVSGFFIYVFLLQIIFNWFLLAPS